MNIEKIFKTFIENVDYSIAEHAYITAQKTGNRGDIDAFSKSSGLHYLETIISDCLKGISTQYFFEYSIITSMLNPASEKLLCFSAVKGGEKFKEKVQSYVKHIVNIAFPKGEENFLFNNPTLFWGPQNIENSIYLSKSGRNLWQKHIVADIEKAAKEEIVPNVYLDAGSDFFVSNMTYNRLFSESLKDCKSIFRRYNGDEVKLLGAYKYAADTLRAYYDRLLTVPFENYYYLTFPLIAARNKSMAKEYEDIWGTDSDRYQGFGNLFLYFRADNNAEAAKINAACVDIFHKVNDAARLFSLNYTFNIGLEVRALVKQNATRMAVGSIMSRNGSHNIGSHVLSALSHNTGIMPDDRVLYQYLQQRMDYTATVTTDFPNWTAPTRFAGNLMKTFFSQRHLLEHISESEGLGAYHFQGRNLADKQTAKIKLHLRKFSPPQNFPPPKEVADNAAEKEKIWSLAYNPSGHGDGEWLEFTNYSKKKTDDKIISLLDDDVTVAIPGGVVGQHAFYTVVENIIRNAAKHEWAMKTRNVDNLDIHIDFIDRTQNAEVEFTIWDNMSDVLKPLRRQTGATAERYARFLDAFSGVNKSAKLTADGKTTRVVWALNKFGNLPKILTLLLELKQLLSDTAYPYFAKRKAEIDAELGEMGVDIEKPVDENIKKFSGELEQLMRNSSADEKFRSEFEAFLREPLTEEEIVALDKVKDYLPLHWKQQILLAKRLINEQGELRRENWGLAEMKISVGYLQRRSIGEIGGLEEGKTPIITPVAVPDAEDRDIYHLGYRFVVPKSKKILIAVSGENNLPANSDNLKDAGIYFKKIDDIDQNEKKDADGKVELDYEYVILPEFGEKEKENWLLPFRVLINQTKLDAANQQTVSGNLFGAIDYDNLIAMTDPAKIKKIIYDAWITGVEKKCGVQGNIYLQVQADAAASGGGQGLVADLDLYHVLFGECSHSVLLDATRKQKDPTAKLLTTLLALTPLDPGSFPIPQSGETGGDYIRARLAEFCDRFKRELSFSDDFKADLRLLYNCSPEPIRQSVNPFERAFLRNVQQDMLNGGDFVKNRIRHLIRHLEECDRRRLGAELDIFCGKLESPARDSECGNDLYDDDEQSVLRRNIEVLFGSADTETADEFSALVDKLNSAFLTSEVFLRKYEENISTLPPFYKEIRKANGSGDASGASPRSSLSTVQPYRDQTTAGNIVRYVRHDNTADGLYVEALSGSQSYLNTLVNFDWGNPDLVVRLAETALPRVLIVDERVCNFLKPRNQELNACRKMRIFAVDAAGENNAFRENDNGFVTLNRNDGAFGIPAKKYDVLIIHQGIIDKWRAAHDRKAVGELLTNLKGVVPYVVVTTGRGRPDNIPDDARVLPFSTVESTIFRKYPEKMVLVNTVLNILPAKLVEGEN